MAESQIITQWGASFLKGSWRYIRQTFSGAGQDSFTQPPSQNEDMLQSSLNVLPPLDGGFRPRWGYRLFNNNTFSPNATSLATPIFAYQNDSLNFRKLVIPQTTGIPVINEDGTVYQPNLFTPVMQPRMMTSRSYGYFASGQGPDLKKWDGNNPGAITKWGILAPSGAPSSSVQMTAGLGTDVQDSLDEVPWTNPGGVTSSVSPAIAPLIFQPPFDTGYLSYANSDRLQATQFGFSVAAGQVITGIEITLTGSVSYTSGTSLQEIVAGLMIAGVAQPTNPATFVFSGTGQVTATFGGPGYLFNASLGPSDVNDTGFGVFFRAFGAVGPADTGGTVVNHHGSPIEIDWSIQNVQITLFNASTLVATASGAGNITLVSGRTYFAAFQNGTTGHISDLSVPSNSTGPQTLQEITLSDLPASTDPQVTTVLILATSDGGDQEQLYYCGQVANGTTTFLDNTPDTSLVLNNVYLELDTSGDEIGISFNDPPPADLRFPIKHRGRIYGVSGVKNLFFTKSEAELTTSTGLIVGKFEEAWPPLNFLDISPGAAEILGLLSDGQVLYIGTERQIIRLFGDGPATFLQPEALFQDVGILNQDVWQMVFLEGNPVGAMWLTHDYRVIGSDFNTYQDVGTPVQNILNTANQAVGQTCNWAAFMANGQFAFYILAIATGPAIQPNILLVFDLKLRQWYTWQLSNIMMGAYFQVSLAQNAVQNLLLSSSGPVYNFDPTIFQDRVGDLFPTSFPIQVQTSFTPLGDPAARKYLNEIEVQTGDPNMMITVEGASTTAQFASPNLVRGPSPMQVKPRGEYGLFLASAVTKDRYYRFTFTSTSDSLDYLRGYNVEGVVLHRV